MNTRSTLASTHYRFAPHALVVNLTCKRFSSSRYHAVFANEHSNNTPRLGKQITTTTATTATLRIVCEREVIRKILGAPFAHCGHKTNRCYTTTTTTTITGQQYLFLLGGTTSTHGASQPPYHHALFRLNGSRTTFALEICRPQHDRDTTQSEKPSPATEATGLHPSPASCCADLSMPKQKHAVRTSRIFGALLCVCIAFVLTHMVDR